MLAIQVRLLAGRYVATQYDERDRAEWPPHPARLFAAAVSAWADVDEPDPRERAALTWWESLGPPTIVCSPDEEIATRTVVTHFVPVNDVTALSRDATGVYVSLTEALTAEQQLTTAAKTDARALGRAQTAARRARERGVLFSQSGRAPETALGILPDNRIRQARTFPSSTPPDDTVIFTWPDAAVDAGHAEVLDQLLGRVARLGHTSSPVDVAVVSEATRAAFLEPAEHGEVSLRVAVPGQLDALVEAHATHGGVELRTLPTGSTAYRRRVEVPSVPHGDLADRDWLLFDLHPRSPISKTVALTRALRASLMKYAEQPPAAILTGHRQGTAGARTEPALDPHAAYVALPYVGSEYADGSIHALAVIMPRNTDTADRDAVIRAAAEWQINGRDGGGRLVAGGAGRFQTTLLRPEDASVTARPATWTRPARCWSSVTPVALDRHPGGLDSADPTKRERAEAEARSSIAQACLRSGFGEPVAIGLRADAPVRGARPVGRFPPFTVGKGGLRRWLVHVELTFAKPVRGPVLLGAGRFFGLGLFWPHPEQP